MIPKIDFHAHLGNHAREQHAEHPPITPEQLIDRMNRHGIDISVLLPLESPEGGWGYSLTENIVAARDQFPERFIAFLCVDPRYPNAAKFIDYFVKQCGCKGFGEHVNGLAFDDPLNKILYARCDAHGLPLVFGDDLGCFDQPGLPRLEACLKEFPNVKFCGHGPGFWSAISADDDRSVSYPKTRIKPGGTLDRLLEKYDNLYADLSAGSGSNAMTRDPDFARGFVQRHWKKMLWGTDYCVMYQHTPQVEWIERIDIPEEMRNAIARGNAMKMLGLSTTNY